jgi:hypothetical protein
MKPRAKRALIRHCTHSRKSVAVKRSPFSPRNLKIFSCSTPNCQVGGGKKTGMKGRAYVHCTCVRVRVRVSSIILKSSIEAADWTTHID